MEKYKFPEIQRGNGVSNDNIATLGDIMKASLEKTCELEEKINKINNENLPREKKSYWLLVASVVIALSGIVIELFSN
ncbi:hypothetical protein A2121_01995 [Candidatus Nomurabacteria bacterium GWB1_40_6]|uniref:Uncharacterized protein n=1 Tax=Candidatus Nomurabacteria bacterium GWB1_40_6 TaxID=1801727 RepID=A0A1F6TNM0_9BACT|nr:MAG: hypothetical protein A2121_01995 [Candidatus Nomurabacteria bacterium GWB1_40_6]